jgi:predicted PurR-regulated permease PerM
MPTLPARKSPRDAFAQRAVTAALIAAGVLAVFLALRTAVSALIVIFAAVLFSVLLSALAGGLARRTKMGYRVSLAVVVVLLIALAAFAGFLLGPDIADGLDQLRDRVPRTLASLRERLGRYQWGRDIVGGGGGQAGGAQSPGTQQTGAPPGRVLGIALGAVGNVVIVLFLGLFLAAEPRLYRDGTLRLFPRSRRERVGKVMDEAGEKMKWWLAGRFITMVVVAVTTSVGLKLLDVPLALVLGLIAGLLNFVPFIGPIVAAVPAVLFAASTDMRQAGLVILLFVVIQTLEGYVLTPLIDRRMVSEPPALSLASQLVLGMLAGTLGVMFASPLTVVALLLVQRFYVEDTLEADAT